MLRLALATMGIFLFSSSSASCETIDLFNGQNLDGFTVHGPVSWAVENGILKNTSPADAHSFLQYDTPLPSSDFVLETRVRIVNGMRFRLHTAFNELYLGNEGFWSQFEVYGSHLFNVNEVGDDSYVLGQWYDLRLAVDRDGGVQLYKDGVLTHTASVLPLSNLQVALFAGDGWSTGMIEIESLQYVHPVPAPSSLTALSGVGVMSLFWVVRRRTRQQRFHQPAS